MNITPQWIAQDREITAATSLLNHADAILGEFRFSAYSLEPLLTVWSIGAEKLLKMSVGFIHIESHQTWPSKSEMQSAYGHDISVLDRRCRTLLRERIDQAVHPQVVRNCLTEVDANPLVDDLLQMLTRYAKSGRFYNLDDLASAPQVEASPSDLWEDLRFTLVGHDPALAAGEDQAAWEIAVRRMHEEIRAAARLWRNLYYRAWIQGVCGPTAKQMSAPLGEPLRR